MSKIEIAVNREQDIGHAMVDLQNIIGERTLSNNRSKIYTVLMILHQKGYLEGMEKINK